MRVAVIGTGLIGTSVALALREQGVSVWLADTDPEAARLAVNLGAGEPLPETATADVAVIAVPPAAVAATLAAAQARGPGALVAATRLTEPQAGELGPTGRPYPAFPHPEPLLEHGPARTVAVCNQKGGVGKTTTTINLGAALAEQGRRVLLVDFDPQGALSVGLGIQPHDIDNTVYNLLMERDVTAHEVRYKTSVDGMDLLPSNIDLSGAEVQLVHEVGREYVLGGVLQPLLPEYDVIMIDCQPSLGLLTINALAAADGVVIPLECEYFAMRGVALLMETIDKVSRRLNTKLTIDGLLATMYDSRTLHTREVLASMVNGFGDQVFHTVINRTVRFPDATVAGEPITSFDSGSMGANSYRELAKEVLERWRQAGDEHGG